MDNNSYYKSVLESKVGHTVFSDGTELPQRENLNIKSPLVAEDDPETKTTNLSLNVDTDALDLDKFIPPIKTSGSNRYLGLLNDVWLNYPEEGQILQYINEKWVNRHIIIPELSGHKLLDNDGHEFSQMKFIQFLGPLRIENNFEEDKSIVSVELPELDTSGELDLSKFIPPDKIHTEYKYLRDLLEVNIDQAQEGQFLQYVNQKWVNRFIKFPEPLGHKILDDNDIELSQRTYFQIKGPLEITDDFDNDRTILSVKIPEVDTSGELDLSRFNPPDRVSPEYKYLRDLLDVLVDDAEEGECLQYIGGKWINKAFPEFPELPLAGHILLDKDGNELTRRNKVQFGETLSVEDDPINDLLKLETNIDSSGEIDLSKFVPPSLPTDEFKYLHNLKDTGIDTPIEGQILEYIGGKWVNITRQITLIETLEAGENEITFNNIPTTENYILELYTTVDGLEYVSSNDTISGSITYTFEEQENDIDCMLIIKIV